ncbi:retron St85 family RNA-directed DNA polymerase [Acinetobacter guillouiae]|uniref:retron St85 family RNA-directed DNA polymerase n=1 Tax=Acinetobacter guillouiae TaxID=106649 RepID=UPI001CD48CEF|nr:retron St85 family RNA-directed DNA polymerase [Acinetobacter guillouiae]
MCLIDDLVTEFSKSKNEILEYSFVAPNKYKVYKIPKRKTGERVIAQPTKELKSFQRYIVNKKLNILPIHNCAFAYVKLKNIKENANQHKSNSYLLNMDLEDFFNSITPSLFWKVWGRILINLPDLEDRKLYENFLFWKPKKFSNKLILSIGAPSSPFISNFILYELDDFLFEFCKINSITYSRYADDLTFSTNIKDILFSIPNEVESKILELYEGAINLNTSKTYFSSKARNRHVTGLVLSNDGKISIGRSKKKFVKHLIFQYMLNRLNHEEILFLRGYLNFIKDVEPEYISILKRKYSDNLILRIMVD